MTSAKHLHEPGNTHHLAQHLGNPESNLVSAERYITMMPERRLPSGMARRYPDLLIALGVDPAAYYESNGYIIGEQGKPPDFVLEVASASTADEDTGPKRLDYEALGITEYWRFDETGEHHKTKLADDRVVNGRYEHIAIEELADGALRGYSAALNLFIRWEHGRLGLARPGDRAAHRHLPERTRTRQQRGDPRPSRGRGPRPGRNPRRQRRGPYPRVGRGEPAAARRVIAPQTVMEQLAKPLS